MSNEPKPLFKGGKPARSKIVFHAMKGVPKAVVAEYNGQQYYLHMGYTSHRGLGVYGSNISGINVLNGYGLNIVMHPNNTMHNVSAPNSEINDVMCVIDAAIKEFGYS